MDQISVYDKIMILQAGHIEDLM